ncbi:hypothetical protein [Gelidibacter sp.]|uniref:hypothetical protein n=1 Tax=Gelidibacter sp. TaxID=2018083 RepID=UPI0032637C59
MKICRKQKSKVLFQHFGILFAEAILIWNSPANPNNGIPVKLNATRLVGLQETKIVVRC